MLLRGASLCSVLLPTTVLFTLSSPSSSSSSARLPPLHSFAHDIITVCIDCVDTHRRPISRTSRSFPHIVVHSCVGRLRLPALLSPFLPLSTHLFFLPCNPPNVPLLHASRPGLRAVISLHGHLPPHSSGVVPLVAMVSGQILRRWKCWYG
ncbi:hypothetical protein FA95DRAFT_1394420 [Auriscalpium vulgare]|uniref:Uncharacterized protein n=1 Tax=Auriscalpium vulgare TaxID=40419 RepID=A0ACB8RQC9_9AGAM|nr:hypothetical protein FA95DRAFT_1394420 [Auriscalpium vulgare]